MTNLARFFLSIFIKVVFATDIQIIETNQLPREIHENFVVQGSDVVEKIELGRKLFEDKKLSRSALISCRTCHQQARAFTINVRTFLNTQGNKNVPVLFNRAGTSTQTWEGVASSLEQQIKIPLFAHDEMNMTDGKINRYLNSDTNYIKQFKKIYGNLPNSELAQNAIVTFVRSIYSADARFDEAKKDEFRSFTESELQGKALFENKFKCSSCHTGYNFTNEKVMKSCTKEDDYTEIGQKYIRKYKVPTLRNLKYTAPYLHNGRLKSIKEVIKFYEGCLIVDTNGEPITPKTKMTFSENEMQELEKFLNTLNGKIYLHKPTKER